MFTTVPFKSCSTTSKIQFIDLQKHTLSDLLSPTGKSIKRSCAQSLSCVQLFVTLWTVACRLPALCYLLELYPLNQWCHQTISSSVTPFFFCLQSFPVSGSFPVSQLCIRWPKYWSFSFSIISYNEYSGLTSFRIDLLAVQGTLLRIFASTTIQKHQFFGTQPSLWTNSHIYTWLVEKS